MLATLVAFYLPSSVAGEIVRPLSILSLLLTCGLLGALAVQRHGLAHPAIVITSLGMLALLLFFTLVSPFTEISPGVVFIYTAIAIMYALNLREILAPRALGRFFLAINVVSLGLGFGTVLGIRWSDSLLTTYYNAFYRELLSNMVLLLDKPVLTFATHSMAGFMIYLLFYMNLATYQRRRGVLFLAIACLHVVLLVRLQSTTSIVYAAVALLQLAALVAGRRPLALPLAIVCVVVALGGMLVFEGATSALAERTREALVGDKIRGLASRYATGGLLAGSLTYLSQHPLRPIGFGFSERLYYADSGYVVNMLRGSVPLLAAMYGGLFLFLRSNLHRSRDAVWIFVVIMAFEVGFTPLHYFRFIGFAPFMIVYLNSLDAEAAPRDCRRGND